MYLIENQAIKSKVAKNKKSALYDPDLPTASAVLASLSCVATQYASEPSLGLATLASSLAQTLTAPEYAETKLISTVAKRLIYQWELVVRAHQQFEAQQLETAGIPESTTLQ